MERLTWVKNDFICKELYAPFVVKKDIDYYSDLKSEYRLLKNQAVSAGADQESINLINRYVQKIYNAINSYYKGKISSSHTIIKNYIKDCLDNDFAVNTIINSDAFPGVKGSEIQLFRARISDDPRGFKSKDMLHLPIELRGKTGNYRFSIPGIPSLYLGNSSYACWIETGRPSDHAFNVSPVLVDGTQKIFNLAVKMRDFHCLNELAKDKVHCWLKLLILMIATSYTVEEANRVFKSEYIISQSVMLACNELNLDGVAYFSKRVDDEMFANVAINIALFTTYKKGKAYSDLCEHIKIDDSYNFALFKQLAYSLTYKDYELRVRRTGLITNIGNYKRQYPYDETEFFRFDKFMFTSWNDKDTIQWGNALQ